ncbi:hypothetical protein [Natronorubrum aibiense]|uniref:Uncharacterized protein n=1 Tax=Natronorubrum aibiense TaxID=348826 RepID=A0A5P9P8T3_9EURY|nr:hypothetical protein [Natronorubrum aibiense]QFU84518.1 hypothetical protein GCU68_18525 [Natronorubrum aibiense]
MALVDSDRSRQLVLFASLGVIALLTGVRVIKYEPSPWNWVAIFAIGTAFIFGPITWAIRDRLPKERRERLSYVAGGVALLCVSIVLGLGLIGGRPLFFLDVVVLGNLIGFAVASLIERIIIPEQLRGTTQ